MSTISLYQMLSESRQKQYERIHHCLTQSPTSATNLLIWRYINKIIIIIIEIFTLISVSINGKQRKIFIYLFICLIVTNDKMHFQSGRGLTGTYAAGNFHSRERKLTFALGSDCSMELSLPRANVSRRLQFSN